MTARWRESLILGVLSFLFTFLFSNLNNTWQMSLFRAGIGFLLFFLLGYIIRFLFHQIASKKSTDIVREQISEELSGQVDFPNRVDINQKVDPLFQEITLGSLHKGDIINKPEEFS